MFYFVYLKRFDSSKNEALAKSRLQIYLIQISLLNS